jgi:hypothetical protein
MIVVVVVVEVDVAYYNRGIFIALFVGYDGNASNEVVGLERDRRSIGRHILD